MKIQIFIISILMLTLSVSAKSLGDHNKEVLAPILNLFDAMREGDSEKFLSQFSSNAKLERAMPDGSIKLSDLKKFAQFIGTSDSLLDEQLLAINVQVEGALASVWTPFVFYRDKTLSHCGANSFQLVNTGAGWKIVYLIDITHSGNCEDFIKKYKK